jgi:hypothetical protein
LPTFNPSIVYHLEIIEKYLLTRRGMPLAQVEVKVKGQVNTSEKKRQMRSSAA